MFKTQFSLTNTPYLTQTLRFGHYLPEKGKLAGPDDVLLAIEVADTSIRHDQQVKGKLYSEAGIADYWIVNLPKRRIEVYREPRPDGYRTVTSYAPGETLSPLAFADVVLSVGDVLGAKA